MGVELALGAVGDEAAEQIGLAGGEELEGLVGGQFALEDGTADADAVGFLLGDEGGDVIGLVGLIDLDAAAVGEGGIADEL